MKPYDAVRMAEEIGRIVSDGGRRKYYRFRPAGFYGGIATADTVGCCLRCVFCWSWKQVVGPAKYGELHTPEAVARKLVSIARKKRFQQMRISGNEPTISRRHLIRVLELIPGEYRFILETNGILIGAERDYAEDLAKFPNLHVRVSIKGTNPGEFARLTGAGPEGFHMQLGALGNLLRRGVSVNPACMVSFSPPENIRSFRKELEGINRSFRDFEEEELICYPAVEARLKKVPLTIFSGPI